MLGWVVPSAHRPAAGNFWLSSLAGLAADPMYLFYPVSSLAKQPQPIGRASSARGPAEPPAPDLGTVLITGHARNAHGQRRPEGVPMNDIPLAEDAIRSQLAELGLAGGGAVHRNLPPAELIGRALARGEGILAANGALVVKTGEPFLGLLLLKDGDLRRGRPSPRQQGSCWGDVNKPCKPALFDRLLDKARGYLHDRDLYVFDGFAGAKRSYQLPVGWSPRNLPRALRRHAFRAAHGRRTRVLRPRLHRDQLRGPRASRSSPGPARRSSSVSASLASSYSSWARSTPAR